MRPHCCNSVREGVAHRTGSSPWFAMLLMWCAVSPALSQGIVERDEDGVFSAAVNSRRAIPDTILSVDEHMVWVQHRGARRIQCAADLPAMEGAIGSGVISWSCDADRQDSTYVEYEIGVDTWFLTIGPRANGTVVRFKRVGKKIFADDTLPRAVQPPRPFGDSVVLAVRRLYERVNTFPCVNHSDGRGFLDSSFVICARHDTIGRVRHKGQFETTGWDDEYTFDDAGHLRFAFVVEYSGQIQRRRYYFADGRLVRATYGNGTGTDSMWMPSATSWVDRDSVVQRRAADCLRLARIWVDSTSSPGQRYLRCPEAR